MSFALRLFPIKKHRLFSMAAMNADSHNYSKIQMGR